MNFDKKMFHEAGEGRNRRAVHIFFPIKSSLQHSSLKNRTNNTEKLINSV